LASLEPDLLEAGDVLDGFAAPALDGQMTITYGSTNRNRIFLYLSPDCPYCDEQMPYWRQLVDQVDDQRFETVVLARATENVEGLRKYLADGGLNTVPAALISDEIRRRYRLLGTPMTVIVGPDGTVVQQWRGRWTSEDAKIAQGFFGVSFMITEAEISQF
jgi:peroxiredoxin